MNKITTIFAILGAFTFTFTSVVNAADRSIMFEFGFGFGKSGEVSYSSEERKKLDLSVCKNRNYDGLKFMALRLRSDDVELHGASWWHDAEIANCERDSYAIGLGYVLSTRDEGMLGVDEDSTYLSWTPGVAYTWGENKNFGGQEQDGTNWRLHGNWQMFNRLAIGAGHYDSDIEVAVHRYGTFDPNHGEYFWTVGLGLKDLDDNRPNNSIPTAEIPLIPEEKSECIDCENENEHPNNGGGNGSEGSSPEQSENANDDENHNSA